MGTRGRKSAAALAIVSPVEVVPRPGAPAELNDEQAAEWKAVVERMPADWFGRETHALLVQYCRHVVAARRIAQIIEAMENLEAAEQRPFVLEDYDRALKMQEREGRAISSLATRMRITQQTSYDKSKKKPGATKRPWE